MKILLGFSEVFCFVLFYFYSLSFVQDIIKFLVLCFSEVEGVHRNRIHFGMQGISVCQDISSENDFSKESLASPVMTIQPSSTSLVSYPSSSFSSLLCVSH